MAPPPCPGCSRAVRWPAAACMAPTGWPATACSGRRCSPTAPRARQSTPSARPSRGSSAAEPLSLFPCRVRPPCGGSGLTCRTACGAGPEWCASPMASGRPSTPPLRPGAAQSARCPRSGCARRGAPRRWCARLRWLVRRAAAAISVLIFPKAAISGTATTSCTKREEHALTVTFEPITEALAPERIEALISAALAEDIGAGDVTTDAVIPMDMTCRGKVVCKEDGVVAGLSIAKRVFQLVEERMQFDAKTTDGEKVQADQIVARLYGPARGMLRAERVALNFLQHLSGFATTTSRIVTAVEGPPPRILDTRKSTPGPRRLEKYAT